MKLLEVYMAGIIYVYKSQLHKDTAPVYIPPRQDHILGHDWLPHWPKNYHIHKKFACIACVLNNGVSMTMKL